MALKLLTRRGAIALLVAATTMAVVPSTAMARWRVHNDADVTQITAPPGGTEDQTCLHRLRGQSGWATAAVDPSTVTVPDSAFQPVPYDIWQAPDGSSADGFFTESADGTGIDFVQPDGTTQPATLLRTFQGPSRSLLPSPEPIDPPVPGEETNYVFTSGNFNVSLPSTVRIGQILGLKPSSGGSTFINLTVVDCSPVTVRIDVRPGSATNTVYPHKSTPLLPVLVYGSATLDVRSIAAVHLQNAGPKSVSEVLRRPYDADGDGYLDRRYYFAPSATGIRCGQTSVTLTGRTTAGLRFTGTDAIHTVC